MLELTFSIEYSVNIGVYLNPLSKQPQLRDSKQKHGCPIAFECIKSTEYASICCKTQPVCPSAESLALFKAHASEPRRCSSKELGACPGDYTCQQAKNMESTCCTPPLECPFGMRALREQFGHPHICSFGVEGICPMDHICTRSTSNPSRFLCCRPQLRCVAPFVDASTQKTLQCYPGKLMNTAFFFRLLSLS
uniref:WAP domain-containing protein n=1 Tax=Ascaris lumbricoides TaxID=6252 RepID=A0A0M3HN21_ASCLU